MTATTKKDVALVLLGGGLAGAVSAGFVTTLCKNNYLNKFSTIYGYSVGTYAYSFGLAHQPEIIEEVWRERVHGYLLVNPFNFLTFGIKPVLKLEYLSELFQKSYPLDVTKALSSETKLKYVLMEYYSGNIDFVTPSEENIFDLMTAACAVPFVHGPKEVDGKTYLDPTFVYDIAPGIEEIVNKHDEVVVVYNFPDIYMHYSNSSINNFYQKYCFPLIAKMYPASLQEIFKDRTKRKLERIAYLKTCSKVTLLQPENFPLRHAGDTNKERLNKTFDEGVRLAEKFLKLL